MRSRVAVIAAGPDLIGGQAAQATSLVAELRADGHRVVFIPINHRFPGPVRWLRRVPYARTLINETLMTQ